MSSGVPTHASGCFIFSLSPLLSCQTLIERTLELDLVLGRAQQDLRHDWRNAGHDLRLQSPAATRKNLRHERAPHIDQVTIDLISACVLVVIN
jgi:hypothetical protein